MCGAAVALVLGSAAEDPKKKISGSGWHMESDGMLVVHSYRCLPDTVDPRAPKGN